ncbi:hypothetical protein ACJMK2_017348 [Sinanodonta woodiana]|uniref:Exportin-T n=1 Tax=Sinanodonta woodiana TaxID=1069815 RepID=A0ABD3UZX1_SINWO
MDIQALQGLGLMSDRDSQARTLQYFEQLKASVDGWQLCIEAFTSGIYDRAIEEKSFLKNKMSQIVSLAFVVDYPHRWPDFFSDLLSIIKWGLRQVDMYLRVLLAIDTEVVDRDIVHTHEETRRNSLIKDMMREDCVKNLADSWLQILTEYESSHAELVCTCLEVIGKYISWIEINLIANDRFVPLLVRFMGLRLLRESACDCIHDILSKGMEPLGKVELVESFTTVLQNSGSLQPPEDEDDEFVVKLSRLVNNMGVQLISSWQKLKGVDDENAVKVLEAVESKVNLLFHFFGDEDDDISGSVAPFVQDYITVLKQMDQLLPKQRENVERLMYLLIKKMKFDESYNFEQEGEDEAMFQEYRKQLRVIFNNLAQLDCQLALVTVHKLVSHMLPHWKEQELCDVEVTIALLYQLGEALPTSHGQHFSGNAEKASVLQEMMRTMLKSGVSCHGHKIVQLQYFETLVRYDRFFTCEPLYIPDTLRSFLDERGFHHPSSQVRSRSAYLFSRFAKTIRIHLQNYLPEIFQQLHDLLVLNMPENGSQTLLSNEDQLFLYETVSTLIVTSNFPPEKKSGLMKEVLAPIAENFTVMLKKMATETNEQIQLLYAQSINNAMALASRASKGFSGQQTMHDCGCEASFTDLLKIFLQAINVPVQRPLIHVGLRQYLHRMVVCLEKDILPFIPLVLEQLIKQPEARELHDFIPLVNQLIMKFKGSIGPFLQEVFMPLVTAIFRTLTAPGDELDQQKKNDNKMLQKSYYLFLSTIVSNDLMDVLKNQDAQNLQEVLVTIVQGAVEFMDPPSQKLCFNILRKLTEAWGGLEGVSDFVKFIYDSMIPACFLAPLRPSFDIQDGQTALALGECALCLKIIYENRGEEMLTFLRQDYLPTLQMSTQQITEFCQALQLDIKLFRNYYKQDQVILMKFNIQQDQVILMKFNIQQDPVILMKFNLQQDPVILMKFNLQQDPVILMKFNIQQDPVILMKFNIQQDPVILMKFNLQQDPVILMKFNLQQDPVILMKFNTQQDPVILIKSSHTNEVQYLARSSHTNEVQYSARSSHTNEVQYSARSSHTNEVQSSARSSHTNEVQYSARSSHTNEVQSSARSNHTNEVQYSARSSHTNEVQYSARSSHTNEVQYLARSSHTNEVQYLARSSHTNEVQYLARSSHANEVQYLARSSHTNEVQYSARSSHTNEVQYLARSSHTNEVQYLARSSHTNEVQYLARSSHANEVQYLARSSHTNEVQYSARSSHTN